MDDDVYDHCADEPAPEPADVSAYTFLVEQLGLDDVLLADDLVLDVARRVMAGGGARSFHIADEISGGVVVPGFTHRVARVLGRLADEKRIVRLSPRNGSGGLVWFPKRVRLPEHERRNYVVG
jgi:hypothetical protein